ncbi:MAG: S53 family peptidase [Candidatus Sulfotelmatobacter sp.]
MRARKVLSVLAAALILSIAPTASSAATVGSSATPLLKVGPQAVPAAIAGPNYGLFGCQVVGLNSSATCYDPYQMRHAYNIDTLINAGLDGRGKTIVIIDAFQSPNIVQQLNYFNSFYGLPSLNGLGNPADPGLGTFSQIAPDGLTPFVTGDPNMTGWAQEISLDVLWSHAIAPGANVVLVLAKSNSDADILSATKYAVHHNLGDVISQSFGENESCKDPRMLAQQHQLFAEATRKNITIFASSGDYGAAQISCDGSSFVQAVSNPASDPLVTAVGGTELHAASYCLASLGCDPSANPLPGTYQGEIVWNEPSFGASGGGFSVVYDEPGYQQGTTHRGEDRGVPDVSYSAAVLHGVLTYLNIPGVPVGFYLFGGTSAGSPQWAAILAIADERAGYDLGFINTGLYFIGQAWRHNSASFFDVTSGNNSFVGVGGFNAGPGWDATTGLGSPMADQVVRYLNRFVSPGDGRDEIGRGTPHQHGNWTGQGDMKPH